MRPALLSALAALSGLGLAVPVAQPNPADIVAVLTSLTSKCQALKAPASQLSVLNAPLMFLGAGPWATVITGFTDIITTITAATPATPPTGQFSATDSMAIANAFQGYSTAQTGLIDVVAQSGGVVDMVPAVGPEIRALMEGTTGSVNRFVEPLTGSVGPAAGAVIVRTMRPLFLSLTQVVLAYT